MDPRKGKEGLEETPNRVYESAMLKKIVNGFFVVRKQMPGRANFLDFRLSKEVY